jgi:hypothetical protein
MIAPNKSIVQAMIMVIRGGLIDVDVRGSRPAFARAQDLMAEHVGGTMTIRVPKGAEKGLILGEEVEIECSLEDTPDGPEFVATRIE